MATFVAWRHPLMSWAVAFSVAALYAMAVAGVAVWWLWHNWPRQPSAGASGPLGSGSCGV